MYPFSQFPKASVKFHNLFGVLLIAGLAGCGRANMQQTATAPPPPEVGVITVSYAPVALQTELPGRVEPVRVAQVRARVNGIVQKRLFTEGSEVTEGQPLFQIDAGLYEAAFASAQAALAKAQANLTQAAAQAQRYKPLAEANAVSKQEYLSVIATEKQAEADVAAGKAAVQTAQINLGYARVSAPIAGRIGRALVTEGALVSQNEATQLALVQQTNEVYVNFTQSANEVTRLRSVSAPAKNPVAVPVAILIEGAAPRNGKLLFSDISVDPTSGQVTLRALVPNQDALLLPGQYVRVRLSQATLPSAVLLPQQAVTRSEQGDTVLVVNEDNKTAQRAIKIGTAQDKQWVVLDGLKAGEKVIVDGFQKMRAPGGTVKPVPWVAAAASSSASADAKKSSPASAP
jgi:membrane fusion protein (multidrug efflux system)